MTTQYRRLFTIHSNEFLGYANETLHEACDAAGETGAVYAVPVADLEHNGHAVYTVSRSPGVAVYTETE